MFYFLSCNGPFSDPILQFYSRSYHVTCVSATQGTLYKTVVDDCGNTTTFNLTFNGTDGVQDGTNYECSIKLEADGNNSARSIPVDVVTPLAKSNKAFK